MSGTAEDEALKLQYKAISEPYDRDKVKLFKQNLPALLSNSEPINYKDHLLYKFLEEFKEEQGLNFLKDWYQQLSNGDLNRLLAVYTEFGVKGLERIDKVWKAAGKLLADNQTDVSLLKSLQTNYFPKCRTFLPCLDSQFELALTIIKNFSKNERYIWDNLFQQHCDAVGFDNLYNVVTVFQTFKTNIYNKKLSFPENPEIGKIKSLPVALSRIITILNATSTRDLALVWDGIFKLDLQSSGAIKVIFDAELAPQAEYLILPQMQMEAKNYKVEHDYSTFFYFFGAEKRAVGSPNHGYHSLEVTHSLSTLCLSLPPQKRLLDKYFELGLQDTGLAKNMEELFACCKSEEELQRNFYRFLATRPYRKSLDFYRQALAKINQQFVDSKTRAVFYSMIASSTSSFEASLSEDTETVILETVQELLDNYTKINHPPYSASDNEQLRLHVLDAVLNVSHLYTL